MTWHLKESDWALKRPNTHQRRNHHQRTWSSLVPSTWFSIQLTTNLIEQQTAISRQALTCIVNDADRASDVVDRIGSLIKKAPARKEVVDLNAAILEVTALTRSEAVKTGVTVGMQLAGELPRIQCDRVQLQQVMLNLIVNAIQSMSGVEDGSRELPIIPTLILSLGRTLKAAAPAVRYRGS
jgi:signal transduction histidine kinase